MSTIRTIVVIIFCFDFSGTLTTLPPAYHTWSFAVIRVARAAIVFGIVLRIAVEVEVILNWCATKSGV